MSAPLHSKLTFVHIQVPITSNKFIQSNLLPFPLSASLTFFIIYQQGEDSDQSLVLPSVYFSYFNLSVEHFVVRLLHSKKEKEKEKTHFINSISMFLNRNLPIALFS